MRPNQNKKEKGKQTMPPTMTNEEIDFSQAEDFKLPTAGVHQGNLAGVELAATKKNENKRTKKPCHSRTNQNLPLRRRAVSIRPQVQIRRVRQAAELQNNGSQGQRHTP